MYYILYILYYIYIFILYTYTLSLISPGVTIWKYKVAAKLESKHEQSELQTCAGLLQSTKLRTVGGFRYLYFPNVKDCCKCCTYTAGSYDCGG